MTEFEPGTLPRWCNAKTIRRGLLDGVAARCHERRVVCPGAMAGRDGPQMSRQGREAMWRTSIGQAAGLLVGAALLAVACGTPTAPAGAPAKPGGQSPAGGGAAGSEPAAGAASQAAPGPRQHVRVSYGAAVGSMVPIIAANKLGE